MRRRSSTEYKFYHWFHMCLLSYFHSFLLRNILPIMQLVLCFLNYKFFVHMPKWPTKISKWPTKSGGSIIRSHEIYFIRLKKICIINFLRLICIFQKLMFSTILTLRGINPRYSRALPEALFRPPLNTNAKFANITMWHQHNLIFNFYYLGTYQWWKNGKWCINSLSS